MRSTPDPEVRVLSVTSSESDAISLRRILSHTAWSLEDAGTITEAVDKLSENRVSVVFCNENLPDGSWRDVLSAISRLPDPPELIVTSNTPDDHLWMQVLDSGAYDLVCKPFKADEVFRIVSLSWLHWKRRVKQMSRSHGSLPGAFADRAVTAEFHHR